MSDNQKDTWYEVTLATEHLKTIRIRAAYLNVDERYYPGCLQLKAEGGSIVALVPFGRLLFIQRIDDTAGVPARSGATGPSPAHVAASLRAPAELAATAMRSATTP